MSDQAYFIARYKTAAASISQELAARGPAYFATSFPAGDAMQREITRFVTTGGKRLRPALSHIIAAAYGQSDIFPHLAVEVFHKFLLTHDDIIDRDTLRYGAPTVHAKLGAGRGKDAEHFGNSLGIIAGDLMVAAAHKMVADAQLPDAKKTILARLLAQATDDACFGWYDQFLMDYLPLDSPDLTLERIQNAMVWVTGKYSMTFPIRFGYAVAGTEPPAGVGALADALGLLFQTGDDLLGLFGAPATTGKSNYGDIAQGKKTVPLWFAYQGASAADKLILTELVGKADLTDADAEVVRGIIRSSGALDRTQELLADYRERCNTCVDAIDFPPEITQFFRGFVAYLTDRDK